MAKTDFKLRYNGSILGYFWSLLKPLLVFLVLYIVFSVLMKWNIEHYQLYLLLGIIIWNFFTEATTAGLNSLIAKGEIIKKIYFPRILIVLSSTLSAFITLLLNVVIFFVIYLFSGLSPHLYMLIFPIFLILLYFLVLSISLILSVLQVRFRDICQVWEVVLQAGFFLSPIIYPLSMVSEKYRFYLFLNPITGIVQYSRMLLITKELPSPIGVFYLFCEILILFVAGLLIFKKLSRNIVEKL